MNASASDNKSKQAEIDKLRAELAKKPKEVEVVKEVQDEKALNALNAKYAALESKYSSANKDLSSSESDNKSKQTEIDKLRAELAKKPKEVEVVKEVKDEKALNALNAKYAALEGKYSSASKDLSSAVSDGRSYQKEIDKLKAELAKKPKQVEVVKEVKDDKELNALNKKYAALKNQHTAATKDLNSAVSDGKSYKKQIDKLKAELAKKPKQVVKEIEVIKEVPVEVVREVEVVKSIDMGSLRKMMENMGTVEVSRREVKVSKSAKKKAAKKKTSKSKAKAGAKKAKAATKTKSKAKAGAKKAKAKTKTKSKAKAGTKTKAKAGAKKAKASTKTKSKVNATAKSKAGAKAKKDDLKKIEGIGPKIQSLLHAGGIHTFAKLSKTKVSVVKAILVKAGPRFQMHDPSTWAQQAGLAAKGEWTKLEKLQDKLSGGRK